MEEKEEGREKDERRERKMREDESSFLYSSHQCHRMTSTVKEKFDPLFHAFPRFSLYLSLSSREKERVRE